MVPRIEIILLKSNGFLEIFFHVCAQTINDKFDIKHSAWNVRIKCRWDVSLYFEEFELLATQITQSHKKVIMPFFSILEKNMLYKLENKFRPSETKYNIVLLLEIGLLLGIVNSKTFLAHRHT